MNIALLTISSLSLVCSAGCLVMLVAGAKEMKKVKTQVETDVADVKTKVNATLTKARTALDGLEV